MQYDIFPLYSKFKFSFFRQFAGIETNCNEFFICIVSTICFGGIQVLEPDSKLTEVLMDTIFECIENSDSTVKDVRNWQKVVQWFMALYPSNPAESKEDIANVPVIQSFLLPLLLQHE